MKYNIILSFICVFVSLVSCSMEDDIMDKGTSYPNLSNTGMAYLSFNISANSTATKADVEPGTEVGGDYEADRITTCALFLLDANKKVVGLASKNMTENASTGTIQILTKVGIAKTAVAVLNYNPSNTTSSLLNSNSLGDIKAYRENDPLYRMKVGESAQIDWSGVVGSSSTTEDVPVVNVSITAKSATSLIELNSFNVVYSGAGDEPVVKLTNVELTNLKAQGGLYDEADDNTIKSDYVPMRIPSAEENGHVGAPLNIIKDVYPNTNKTYPVKMRIRFTVDGKTQDVYGKAYEREYIINRPTEAGFTNNSGHTYVQAAYLYSLNVTVKVHTGKVDCAFDCVVKDWLGNIIELDDIYGSKI